MRRLVLSIDDLSDAEIRQILERAAELQAGAAGGGEGRSRVVGLLFGETSLRTRVGFAAAAAHLGWHTIDIHERRHSPSSMIESWGDTLRTLSGYLDVLVARPGERLERSLLETHLRIPFVNAGGVGPEAEHPSQALIDVFSVEQELGPVGKLQIAVCGDLRMRAVRSLLRLLARRQPKRVVLVTVPDLIDPVPLPSPLKELVEWREPWDLDGVDVLYVVGIPHQAIPEARRDTLRVTATALEALPAGAIVLSPLPIIDEIDAPARLDPRVRMFEQSDRALFVRMAVLEGVVRERVPDVGKDPRLSPERTALA